MIKLQLLLGVVWFAIWVFTIIDVLSANDAAVRRLPKLGWLFVDNRFHFTHHSVREKYFDRNYGGVFTIYDRMFGTYVAPEGDALEVTGMPSKLPARTAD